jgi:hypothetical protein
MITQLIENPMERQINENQSRTTARELIESVGAEIIEQEEQGVKG